VRIVLGIVSLALLLILAVVFLLAAWRTARQGQNSRESNLDPSRSSTKARRRGGYFLGFIFALSSPWNIGFWLAVIGSQQAMTAPRSFLNSLTLACAVVCGAICLDDCALRGGTLRCTRLRATRLASLDTTTHGIGHDLLWGQTGLPTLRLRCDSELLK
jgi:threonine/homoserine/homoserine lactone efflux protein